MMPAATPKQDEGATTGYVVYAGKRWSANGEFPGGNIKLRRYNPAKRVVEFISVRADEVTPWTRPAATRKLRDDDYVLEFGPRGAMTIRAARSPTRYVTSLEAIYHSAVKFAVSAAKAVKKRGKR